MVRNKMVGPRRTITRKRSSSHKGGRGYSLPSKTKTVNNVKQPRKLYPITPQMKRDGWSLVSAHNMKAYADTVEQDEKDMGREAKVMRHGDKWVVISRPKQLTDYELRNKLGVGGSDYLSEPVKFRGKTFYVSENRRLNYIGVSTLEDGPTRFFAQGEDADTWLDMYDKKGTKSLLVELDGYGFW